MDVSIRHYYVDEAGDLTLMGRRGKSLLGTFGVSHTFMVGAAHIQNPEQVRRGLTDLRSSLLDDPYLNTIPSLRDDAEKTARCFHAKDDCPEVRMQMFKFLARQDIKVIVGIRRKAVLESTARLALEKGMRLNPDSVYDDLVKTIFKGLLHKADRNVVYFARRGKSSRQVALERAITKAQNNFSRDTGISSHKPTDVVTSVPSDEAGLQAVDYFLWALQRLFERNEDRYFNYLREHFRLIMDFDDTRCGASYGTWYSDKNPLTKEKMLPITG